MSQENDAMPISRRDWNVINMTPTFPPVTRISQLEKSILPADRLRLRSITSEFATGDSRSQKQQRNVSADDFGYHHLLVQRRKSQQVISDIADAGEHAGILVRHNLRVQRINEELGLEHHFIVFEFQPVDMPGRVSTVLRQFDSKVLIGRTVRI